MSLATFPATEWRELRIARGVRPARDISRDIVSRATIRLSRNSSRSSCTIAQAVRATASQMALFCGPALTGNRIRPGIRPFWPDGEHNPDLCVIPGHEPEHRVLLAGEIGGQA